MTTTPLDLIAARAEKASAGPWEEYDANEGTEYGALWCVANEAFHNPPADEEAEWVGVEIHVGDKADAEFIAHAREDVPRLVAALRAVEAVHEPVDALMYTGKSQHHKVKVCAGCGQDDGNWQQWPCPTIRAIRGALK